MIAWGALAVVCCIQLGVIGEMDRHLIEDENLDLPAYLPQDIVADIEAGLDDLRHGRSVPGEVVLASLDAKIAAWKAQKAMLNQNGEDCADSSTSD